MVLLHGSQKIIEVPQFGLGKSITTMDRDSIAQRALILQGNGRVRETPMASQIDMNSIWRTSTFSTFYHRTIQFYIG